MDSAPLFELFDALFPRRCLLCGAAADRGMACADHALAPPGLAGPRCGRCARALPAALPDGGCCPACRRRPPPFARLVAAYDWRASPEIQPWVFALKYGGRADLAEPLGARLARGWLDAAEADDNGVWPADRGPRLPGPERSGALVSFLPLHPRRRAERGFDQAEQLARHAARGLGLGFARTLRRLVATPVQGGPGSRSRTANVRGVFAPPRSPWPASWAGLARRRDPVRGRTVWLVDDVVTSGASAAEAARVLLRLGAVSVGVLALARAGEGEPTARAARTATSHPRSHPCEPAPPIDREPGRP